MTELTEEEVNLIEDRINQELLMIQKCKMYAEQAEDPQVKAKCEQLAGLHRIHCERMLRCVDPK